MFNIRAYILFFYILDLLIRRRSEVRPSVKYFLRVKCYEGTRGSHEKPLPFLCITNAIEKWITHQIEVIS